MTTPITARGWRATFSSLSNRSYRWYWLSSLASFTGMMMQMLSQSWLVYDLTGSPLWLGLVNVGFGVGIFAFSAIGGAVADRVEKRDLLIITQIATAVLTLVVAVLILTGAIELWHLMIFSVVNGIIFSFNMPGRQSIIPALVEREQLMNAIALGSGAMNLTRIAGPAAAGILIGVIGVGWVYSITAGCSMAAVVLLFGVPRVGIAARDANATMKSDVIEGFRYVRHSPTLLSLLALAFVPLTFGMPYMMMMPVFAADVYHVDASGFGFLMAVGGIGALFGSLAVAYLGDFRRKGMLLLSASALFGVFLVIFATSDSFHLSLVLLMAVGAASSSYMAANHTLLQLNVDDRIRGRVMGIYMTNIGFLPAGVLPIAAIAEVVGVQLAVGVGGAIVVLFTLAMAFLRPSIRKL